MPCYDPPPEWSGAARQSGEEAAKLLCEIVGNALAANQPVSIRLMRWYVGHRHVDLRQIADPRMQRKEDPAKVRAEITHVEAIIEQALNQLITEVTREP